MKKLLFILILAPMIILAKQRTIIYERVDILNKIENSDLKILKDFKRMDYFDVVNSNFMTRFKNNYLKASLYIPYIVKYEMDKVILNNIDEEYKQKIKEFQKSSSIDLFNNVVGISVAGKRSGRQILNGEVILSLKYHFLPKLLNYVVNYSTVNKINNIKNYQMIVLSHIKDYQIEKIEKILVNASSKLKNIKKLSKIKIAKSNNLYLVEYDNNSSDIIYMWNYGFIISHTSRRYDNSYKRWFAGIKKIVKINSKLKVVRKNNVFIDFIARNIFLGKKRRDINVKFKKVKENDFINVKISQNSFSNREKRKFDKILKNWKQSRNGFAFALNINKKLTPKFKDFLYKLLVNSTMNKNKRDYNIKSKI